MRNPLLEHSVSTLDEDAEAWATEMAPWCLFDFMASSIRE
jgi:hypothetical protein